MRMLRMELKGDTSEKQAIVLGKTCVGIGEISTCMGGLRSSIPHFVNLGEAVLDIEFAVV